MTSSPAPTFSFRPSSSSVPSMSSSPAPTVYLSGSERLVVSYVSPTALTVTYTRPGTTTTLSRPVPFHRLEPARSNRPLVDLLRLSVGMRSTVRVTLLSTQPPSDPLASQFYNAQRKIFLDGLAGDDMDDDDVVSLPNDLG